MVVESIATITVEATPRLSFKNVLRGSDRWFPTVQSIPEDEQEEFEAETLLSDSPLKIKFSPD